jgi:succinyl-diaminopimelate desuccinylase
MSAADAIALTRELLRFDTVNPPGRERDCARHAGELLAQWGYRVDYHDYEDGRTSVVARAGGVAGKDTLCLTGHLDVVPLGSRAWTRDPFAGETDGDRLYGRGASDMKAGVAAILLAARTFKGKLAGTPGVVLVLTAGEDRRRPPRETRRERRRTHGAQRPFRFRRTDVRRRAAAAGSHGCDPE